MVSYRKAAMLKVILPVLLSGSVAKVTKGTFLKQKKNIFREGSGLSSVAPTGNAKKKKSNECMRELQLDLRETLKKGLKKKNQFGAKPLKPGSK